MSGQVAAIILSAGLSSRMGEFKPLLELAGFSAVERTVETFRSVGVEDIRVVTGHRQEELSPVLERLAVRGIHNPNFRDGMFSSVVAGVATIQEELDAFFIHPVDLPLVRPTTVRALLDAFFDEEGDGIVYPSFLGERGHPPLIAGWLAPEIVRWSGDRGLQGILSLWEKVASQVEVADEQILRDMDTPGDYCALLARAERLYAPSEAECGALLERVLKVEAGVVDHGRAVARVAEELAKEMGCAGFLLDLPLLKAASLLHDLARHQPDHASAGGRLLRGLGYGSVARLVETHMDITAAETGPVTAAELLYLADKLVQGDRCVTLSERFGTARQRHGGAAETLERIEGRQASAESIRRRLEAAIRRPIAEVLEKI